MIPINNSDTSWLIVADYNQDNSIGFPEVLREDVCNVEVNEWNYEDTNRCVGGESFEGVGGSRHIGFQVGSNHFDCVGISVPNNSIFVGDSEGLGCHVGGRSWVLFEE